MSEAQNKIPSVVTCSIIISPNQMQAEIEAVKKIAITQTSIKGFRKGKAPKALAQKVIDTEKIEQQALSQMIPRLLEAELIKEQQASGRARVIVIDQPKYELVEYGYPQGKDVVMNATVQLYPEFSVDHIINKLALSKPTPTEVSQEQVDEFIGRLKQNASKIKQADNSSAVADQISDQDLLTSLNIESMESLAQRVREELQQEAQYAAEQQFEASLVEAMIDSVDVDIPQALIQRENQRITESVQEQLKRMGATIDHYLESQQKTSDSWMEETSQQSRKNVLSMLVMTELVRALNIPITEAEEAEIQKSPVAQQDTLRLMLGQRRALEKIKDIVSSR